jgi:hypothetical protein
MSYRLHCLGNPLEDLTIARAFIEATLSHARIRSRWRVAAGHGQQEDFLRWLAKRRDTLPSMRALVFLWVILGLSAVRAQAGPAEQPAPAGDDEALDYVLVPPSPDFRSRGLVRTIYLNPCRGGCVVGNKRTNPYTNESTVARTPGTLEEFPFGETDWNNLVQCVKHAYELYDVTVTTDEPEFGTDHVEVLVAGSPTALGFGKGTLGISPLSSDCSPLRNVMSFVFAEAHATGSRAELCATVVHESGHLFGLDHALQCRDPMTYLVACGEKAFLNTEFPCGEFRKTRFCRCSDSQNSHVKLMNELGPSGRAARPSGVNISAPTKAIWDGQQIVGSIDEPRWIRSIELWINGFRWGRLPHQAVAEFRFSAPEELADGILDVEVRSINDLGVAGVGRLTATKGQPCQSSASCRSSEVCDQGRCMFPPPTGSLGNVCTAAQDCASWECQAYSGNQRCTSTCSVGAKVSECADTFTCVASDDLGTGMCWPTDDLPAAGGCCGTSSKLPSPLALLVVLGFWRRRRR